MVKLSKEEFQEEVIKGLLAGMSQQEISDDLKNRNLDPFSLSSIEKLLKNLKSAYNAKTYFHLGAIIATRRYYLKK
ncbi:hypothetical protein BWD42_03990 [Sphingobacterium sp. CZ-UAM]|uniref:hypothetical protein n=1 Tax=Sphingobacterium sp. CZ-UAM TaxID=1933868 RepID=UPI00098742EF|nr:hypothetical protein [Sphingobacterium sp. CZ-UAM]OOG19118.1 hypothetical protein BWD42_03990 [Sphingobacterium sp. CZ-UAM]